MYALTPSMKTISHKLASLALIIVKFVQTALTAMNVSVVIRSSMIMSASMKLMPNLELSPTFQGLPQTLLK